MTVSDYLSDSERQLILIMRAKINAKAGYDQAIKACEQADARQEEAHEALTTARTRWRDALREMGAEY